MRIGCFFYFCVLSGCLPHLTFYFADDVCLHTYSERDFGINWTDYYQYCLAMLIWVVTIPLSIFMLAVYFKDNFRYFMYPFLVADSVFIVMGSFLAFVVLGFTIVGGSTTLIKVMTAFNLIVLIYAMVANIIYDVKYAKKDLLRSANEDVH